MLLLSLVVRLLKEEALLFSRLMEDYEEGLRVANKHTRLSERDAYAVLRRPLSSAARDPSPMAAFNLPLCIRTNTAVMTADCEAKASSLMRPPSVSFSVLVSLH